MNATKHPVFRGTFGQRCLGSQPSFTPGMCFSPPNYGSASLFFRHSGAESSPLRGASSTRPSAGTKPPSAGTKRGSGAETLPPAVEEPPLIIEEPPPAADELLHGKKALLRREKALLSGEKALVCDEKECSSKGHTPLGPAKWSKTASPRTCLK